MYYKMDLLIDGTLEVIDRVEEMDLTDGFIYATEKDFNRLDKRIVKDYTDNLTQLD